LSLWLVACGGGAGATDAGGSGPAAQSYFGLAAGQCFEYAAVDGGLPAVGLAAAPDPLGIALHLSRHGQDQRVDYLSFDGGLALLERQDFISGVALTSRSFETPLLYLKAPLSTTSPSLQSSSGYFDLVSGIDGGSSNEQWEVDVLQEGTVSTPSATDQAFELNIVGSAPVNGVNDRRWLTPDAGFVDLYLPDDLGNYVDFKLVDVRPATSGSCAAN
ncbi:MAG: hypothetical protein ACYCWW_01955, partial [Deltaproteobacteria bacterium]